MHMNNYLKTPMSDGMRDDLLDAYIDGLTQSVASKPEYYTLSVVNSGFMFADGFRKSKHFQRYCKKIRPIVSEFFTAASLLDAEDISPVFRRFIACVISDDYRTACDETIAGAGGDLGKLDSVCDWRRLFSCAAPFNIFDFPSLDKDVREGWARVVESDDISLWQDLFERCFESACYDFLYVLRCEVPKIEKSDFCVRRLPDTYGERMLFIKILASTLWNEGCAEFSRCGGSLASQYESRIRELESEKRDSESRLAAADDALSKAESEAKSAKADIDARVEVMARERIRDIEKSYGAQLAELRKKLALSEADLDKSRQRCDELENRVLILESIEDEDDGNASAPGSLNYDSKILFIASRAEHGRIQGTYDRLLQRFPNSKFIYDAADIRAGYDCYVMLTRYMKHHCLYNSSCDFLRAHGYPYVHSESQHADRIADDIFRHGRYNSNSNKEENIDER